MRVVSKPLLEPLEPPPCKGEVAVFAKRAPAEGEGAMQWSLRQCGLSPLHRRARRERPPVDYQLTIP